MGKIKINKKTVLAAVALALFALIAAFARGPYVSNLLKGLILPELSAATGRNVEARSIYLNIFPLFIGANDLRVLDGDDVILNAPAVKAYVEIPGILRKKLTLRRMVFKDPDIRTDESRLKDIIENVKRYLSIERKDALKVLIKTIALEGGKFTFAYEDMSFKGNGLSGEAALSPAEIPAVSKRTLPRINFNLKEVSSSIKGWPQLKGRLRGGAIIKDNEIEIKGLQAGINNSTIETNGSLFLGKGHGEKGGAADLSGDFNISLNIFVESLKDIFALKKRTDGNISGKGVVHLDPKDPVRSIADLRLKGAFYIETLMELLKVDERVEGFVDFAGDIKGPLNRFAGSGKARLKKGNLFGINVDDLTSNVSYADMMLMFKDAKGTLYNGRAEAESTVSISGSAYYSVKVGFSDIDSPAALDLIGWKPDIPFGKVKGDLFTSGTAFNPNGSFSYESTAKGKDFLGRIRRIKGSFRMREDVIALSDTFASTERSTMNFDGIVDLNSSTLSLALLARSSDVKDATSPYFDELSGSGEFNGKLTGKFDNPLIAGKLKFSSAAYRDYPLGEVAAEIEYKKSLLELKDVSISGSEQASIGMKGLVKFPESKELFDLKKPVYDVSLSAKNADLERFVKSFYKKALKTYPTGKIDASVSITGTEPEPFYKGSARIADARMGVLAADSVSMSFSYDYKDFIVEDAYLKKGASTMTLKGNLSQDEKFNVKASGGKVYIKDFFHYGFPVNSYISFKAEGSGKIDDPLMELDGIINGGRYRDADLGTGKIRASVKNKTLLLDASFLDGRATLNGKADIRNDMPWTARLDMKSGRYDFLLASFLKEAPEDLFLNMRASADMSGDTKHFRGNAVISQLNVALYGQSFSNEDALKLELADKKVKFSDVRMRSGSASFKVTGGMEIGRSYDIDMEGSSALSVLKGFSKRIDTIKGDAGFSFNVTGKWENPKINGGVNVSNAVFGIKDVAYRISSINGYFYMDEDRMVIQKLSGKIGGGDINMSGVAYLDGFKIKKFYIDGVLNNIEAHVSKEFPVNFSGNMLYNGTPDAQTISGEIVINRARYRERVEWKSWLLKASAKERPRGELGSLDKAALNIKVSGSENIVIDNNIARTLLRVDMVLRGTVAYPIFFGRVEAKTGTVYFRNNEFRIINASADFSDPRRINPLLEILAETSIKGYNIRLNLEGQMEHFNMVVTSDPPLEEMDILSLLTVGRLGRETKGIESGIGAGEATSFLTGKMQDVVEERVRSITGLDRVEVDPYVSKTTGQVNPRVTVSKRLMGDKLFVTYSSTVGSTENNVLKLEYMLGKNISLIGVRDERGGLGSDVKFRFEFK